MNLLPLSLLLAAVFARPIALHAQQDSPSPGTTTSTIQVVGSVYCDTCFSNAFSRNSYFIPGAEVHIECRFNANSPRTAAHVTFSVNRTTDTYGIYKLEIPSVDGLDCTDGPVIKSSCQASLLSSSSAECSVPASRNTAYEIQVKSKQSNLCVYSFSALSFRPTERNHTLCEEHINLAKLNSSKFLLPYGFPWPPLPPQPAFPIPPLPPFSGFPFPSFPFLRQPPFPFPFPTTPSLQFPLSFPTAPSLRFPFPLPPIPPYYPQVPSLLPLPPSPPTFNLGDPRTWIPKIPSVSIPPPQPRVTLNPWDLRSWLPLSPPSQPALPQSQHP